MEQEKIEKLEKKIKKLENLMFKNVKTKKHNPTEKENLTIIEAQKEIWQDVLELSKEQGIHDIEAFNKLYPIFIFGLECFVIDYAVYLEKMAYKDKNFAKNELKLLQEYNEQFNLNSKEKSNYELMCIKATYVNGEKDKTKKDLEKWIETHPESTEGYEVECNWEFDKEQPDYDKIEEILKKVENKTILFNPLILEKVRVHFEEIGKTEKAKYYQNKIDKIKDDLRKALQLEEIVEAEENSCVDIIEIFKTTFKDNVDENKTIQDYIGDKTEKELVQMLGTQFFFETEEEIEKIKSNVKKYFMANYNKILEKNIKYLPDDVMKKLRKLADCEFKTIDLKETSKGWHRKLYEYIFLHELGIVFIQIENDIIKIHIPQIEEIKKILKNNEIIEYNKDFNEKLFVIKGICEVYGAIKKQDAFNIMKEIYEEIDENYFMKLVMLSFIFAGTSYKGKQKKGILNLDYLYHKLINSDQAKKFLKKNNEIKKYSKEDYIKYGNGTFIQETKAYKMLKEELDSCFIDEEELVEGLTNTLILYSAQKKVKNKNAKIIIKIFIERFEILNKENSNTKKTDIEQLEKYLDEITEELPKW